MCKINEKIVKLLLPRPLKSAYFEFFGQKYICRFHIMLYWLSKMASVVLLAALEVI